MEKEFIPYEQAFELRKLGYNDKCFKWYTSMGRLIDADGAIFGMMTMIYRKKPSLLIQN